MSKHTTQFNLSQDLAERFWDRVNITTANECWEWQQSLIYGYGKFTFHHKTYRSHRIAYELVFGPITGDLVVMHTCDNRKCCNPAHLRLGTQLENIQDCTRKGRRHPTGVKGENHRKAKLIDAQVMQIRLLYQTGNYSQRKLADMFGIKHAAICQIVNRKTWVHLP